MRCEAAELELSARLDGWRDAGLDEELEAHLEACPRCRDFVEGARELRETARLEPAGPVPDLAPRIIDAVQAERAPDRIRRLRPPEGWLRPAMAFAAAAAAAALVLGGLPWPSPGPPAALATEIPERIAEASSEITAYRATFEIAERHFHPEVPERRFTAKVAFEAPERFRAEVVDHSDYPADRWPVNDTSVVVDGDAWRVSGPAGCPREGLPTCAAGPDEVRRLRNREPFEGDASLPTDIVLPVRTMAGSDRVEVTGRGSVAGRGTVTVALDHRDAGALFAYLTEAGMWRPFFPLDRVLVSLDEETWFPLAYEVRASGSPERERWALRNDLPPEESGELLLRGRATAFRAGPLRAEERPSLDPASSWRDGGFREVGFDELAEAAGYEPLVPDELAGLRPYRAGTFAGTGRPDDEVLLSFAEGLTWLKVRETRSWTGDAPFGDVGTLAAPVDLPGGGTALYEPATAERGRRVALHADGWDVFLESNLPPEALLGVAASLPVRGEPLPERWRTREWSGGIVRERVPLAEALEGAPYLLLPARVPSTYELATTHLVRTAGRSGATVFYRRAGVELDGVGIRLHQAPGVGLAPPMDPDVFAVEVDGVRGRYSPTRNRLEWVDDGVYRSIRAPGLGLSALLDLAASLERPEGSQ